VSAAVRIPKADRPALRVVWLTVHGGDLPGAYGDITATQQIALADAVRAMCDAGLWCVGAYKPGLHWSVRVLMSAIRHEPRPTWKERRVQRYRS